MKRAEFRKMTEEEKEEIILGQGSFIASRTEDECRVLLYAYDRSYFEVWCTLTTLSVYAIEMIEDKVQLDPYLDEIGLYEVYERLEQQY
jgi:hypothetical protein